MKKYLLDTHVWYWYLEGNKKLSLRAIKTLENSGKGSVYISPISILEIGMLLRKGRISVDSTFEQWLKEAERSFPIGVLPITGEIALRAYHLQLEHDDPADRLIAATAIEHKLILLTEDRRLLGHDWLKTLG